MPELCSFLLSLPPEEAKEQLVATIGLALYKAVYSCYTVYQIGQTEKGMIGLVPLQAEAGDQIYVLNGGAVPFVFRKGKRLLNGCRLVGECYIHGIMNGEAMQGQYEERDVKLY
jgi:hypothetical protein